MKSKMKFRRTFNSKRRLKPKPLNTADSQRLKGLAAKVRYTGNSDHKRNPGDFGLEPPLGPRPGKTLCDDSDIFRIGTARRLLKEGARRGLISQQERNGWPQNIWAVTQQGIPFEAHLENSETGGYHGYPMPGNDPFCKAILERWNLNDS